MPTDRECIKKLGLRLSQKGIDYSFEDASSGEKNILYASINIARHIESNSLVLIDEPEISLHPNWQMQYVSFLKKLFKDYKSCHFLLTTHSPYLISDLDPNNSSLIAISDRNGDRVTKPIVYSTYAWSIENILYEVFHVRTTRNYYFEEDLRNMINMLSIRKGRDYKKFRELYLKLKTHSLDEKDPLNKLLEQVERELKYVEPKG